MLECLDCHHQFSNPHHWPQDLGSEYSSLEDADYVAMRKIKQRTFARAANVVEQYVKPPATLLEIGSYAGLFLQTCRERGYQATGIEPSRWGVELSGEQGLDVHWGTAEDLLSDDQLGLFDVVVSWDVLEHVSDPRELMRLACTHLALDSYLILSTLDRTNWFARAMGKRWPWLIPMHLHYFDQRSVIALAESQGLEFVSTRAHVHYTSADYAWRRLLGHGDHVESSTRGAPLERVTFPVGFGDVRLYVFRKVEVPPVP